MIDHENIDGTQEKVNGLNTRPSWCSLFCGFKLNCSFHFLGGDDRRHIIMTMTTITGRRRSFVLVLLLEGTRALIPATPMEQSKFLLIVRRESNSVIYVLSWIVASPPSLCLMYNHGFLHHSNNEQPAGPSPASAKR